MSTILKALKRLEGEREVKPPRPLREEVVAALEAAETARLHRGRRGWLLLVAAGGAVAAGVTVWLAFGRPGDGVRGALRGPSSAPGPAVAAVAPGADGPTSEPQPEARAAAGALAQAEAPQLAPAPSPSSVDAAAEAPLGAPGAEAQLPATPGAPPSEVPLVAVVPRPPPAPALQPDDAPAAAPAGPPPGSIPPAPKQSPRAAAELGAPAAPPPPGDVEGSGVASAGRAAEALPKPVRKAAASPRPQASTRVQVANARNVDLLRTVWHPHPERRVALLLLPGESAARELHEGETAQGWTVLSIEPSSVRLLHDGVEVRAAVGGGGR